MKRTRIDMLVVLALCIPLGVGAQTHKCKNTDGTIQYLDSPCPSETTSAPINTIHTNGALQNSSENFKQGNIGLPNMPDESCMRENQSASKYCGEVAVSIVKQCLRERLSPNCAKQVDAGTGLSSDAGCRQELQKVAGPCTQTQIAAGKQCIQDRLSANCKEQTNKFSSEFEKSRKQCEDAMLRLKKVCSGEKEMFACLQAHQAEMSAACEGIDGKKGHQKESDLAKEKELVLEFVKGNTTVMQKVGGSGEAHIGTYSIVNGWPVMYDVSVRGTGRKEFIYAIVGVSRVYGKADFTLSCTTSLSMGYRDPKHPCEQ